MKVIACLLGVIGIALVVPGVVSAGSSAVGGGVTSYRLEESTFQEGCFGGCACPVSIAPSFEGTFLLTPADDEGSYRVFTVSNVRWLVELEGTPTSITGSGVYRIGGDGSVQQRLELDLVIGDAAVEHFDSGFVPVVIGFPRIDVAVSIHDLVCYDTLIEVRATPLVPVPAETITWGAIKDRYGS